MKKKLLFGLLTTSIVAVAASLFAPNVAKASFADGCDHEGNHYDAVAATSTTAGNKEFWACCVCHEQFLSEPDRGTWEDKGAYSGTLESTHIAYVAPVKLQGSFVQVVNAASEYIESIDLVEGSTYNVGETVRIRVVAKTYYAGSENLSKFYLDVDGVRQTLSSTSGAFSADYVVTEGEHRVVAGYIASTTGSTYSVTVTNSEHISIHGVVSGNKYGSVSLDVVRVPGYRATFEYSTNGGSTWTNAVLSFTNNVAVWTRTLTSNLTVRVTETYVGAYTLSFVGGEDVRHSTGTFSNREVTAGDALTFNNVESTNVSKYVSGATSSDVTVSFSTSYNISTLKFTMPSKAVTVTFTFASYIPYTVNSSSALSSYSIVDNPNNSNSVAGLKAGQTYYFKANLNDGYALSGIKINSGELLTPNMELNGAVEFTCPSYSFVIDVIASSSYLVSINYYDGWNETHGTVSIREYSSMSIVDTLEPGQYGLVTFYPSTSNGYELDTSSVHSDQVTLTADMNYSNSYWFLMPSENVEISFEFKKIGSDVSETAEIPTAMMGNWVEVMNSDFTLNISSDNCVFTPKGGASINCAFTGDYGVDLVYLKKSYRFASADNSLIFDVSLDFQGTGLEVKPVTDVNGVMPCEFYSIQLRKA